MGDYKGYSVFLNVSEDIEDTIDGDSEWFDNLKSLKNYYLNNLDISK